MFQEHGMHLHAMLSFKEEVILRRPIFFFVPGLLNLIPCKRTLVSTTNFLWNSYYPLVKSFLHEFPGMRPCYISLNCSTLVGDWQTNLSWCFSFAVTSRRHISLFRQIHSSFPCRSCWLLHGKIVIFAISDKFANIFSSLPFFYCVHFWAYGKALLLLIRNFLRNSWANWFFPIGTFRAQICLAARKLFSWLTLFVPTFAEQWEIWFERIVKKLQI